MNGILIKNLNNSKFRLSWLAFLVLTVFTFATRAWIFGDPVVNMDEQFYLMVGDRMLHGQWPYIDIWDRKPVGLFLIYAFANLVFPSAALGYQLLAALSASLTSYLLFVIARRLTSNVAALAGAAAYPAWLTVFGGIAGQSPVFYNLPMAAAAVLTLKIVAGSAGRRLTRHGGAIMLLTGVAIQIKYTAVFEGIFFGLTLLWAGRRDGRSLAKLAGDGVVWIACALLPTLVALTAYLAAGHLQEFVQANFLSVLGDSNPSLPALGRLAGLVFGLCPLLACCWIAWRRRPARHEPANREVVWIFAWAAASFTGFLAFGVWNDHYVLPLLPPLCLLTALGFGHLTAWRRVAVGLVIGLGLVGGFARSVIDLQINGSKHQVTHLTALVQPHLGSRCLYVNEDLSILYYLTQSCLPTRYVFPQHLALSRYENALGTDQMAELRRVLAHQPDVIVLSTDPDTETRFATRQLVQAELRKSYRIAGAAKVGQTTYAVYAAMPRQ